MNLMKASSAVILDRDWNRVLLEKERGKMEIASALISVMK